MSVYARDDYQWHDATLHTVTVQWEKGHAIVVLHTVIGPHEIIATGLRDLRLPRAFEWGPSVSINYLYGPTVGEGGALDLSIHMQSGDVITLTAENFHGLTLSDLPPDTQEIMGMRNQIAAIAVQMLNGTYGFIEGARDIKGLWWTARLAEDGRDRDCFVLIDSETDTLPLGAVRDLWNPQALTKLQPQIDHAEQWAREIGQGACKNLIRRLGLAEPDTDGDEADTT